MFTPLLFNEGFNIDHAGNQIATWHVDFRKPHGRMPIGPLIRYSQTKDAIEKCRTIKLARPSHHRQEGETLVYDKNECLVIRKTVVERDIPFSDTEIQSLKDEICNIVQSFGSEVISLDIDLKMSVTETDEHRLEWGFDTWIFCTSMAPTSDAERRSLWASLDPKYDHESYIPSPRTFAQMLARAYVDEYGAPYDAQEPFQHTLNGVSIGNTYHRQMTVVHGPVVYVNDPYETYAAAYSSSNKLVRTLLPIFVKRKRYSEQLEYRFVIPDEALHEADWKIMRAPPMLLSAIGVPGDGKGPMVVPAFDTTGG